MKFENKKQSNFLGQWRYQAQFACRPDLFTSPTGEEREKWRSKKDRDMVEIVEIFLRYRAEGKWSRSGNHLYLESLADVFSIRLLFEDNFDVIREAVGP